MAGALVDLDRSGYRAQIRLRRRATRIVPLADVTETEPSRPRSSTAPEVVPTITSVPVGHRTAIPRTPGPAGSRRPDPPVPRNMGATVHDHAGSIFCSHVDATRVLLMRRRTRASGGCRATPPLSHHDE